MNIRSQKSYKLIAFKPEHFYVPIQIIESVIFWTNLVNWFGEKIINLRGSTTCQYHSLCLGMIRDQEWESEWERNHSTIIQSVKLFETQNPDFFARKTTPARKKERWISVDDRGQGLRMEGATCQRTEVWFFVSEGGTLTYISIRLKEKFLPSFSCWWWWT